MRATIQLVKVNGPAIIGDPRGYEHVQLPAQQTDWTPFEVEIAHEMERHVPYSELAMHTKVAGKPVTHVMAYQNYTYVRTEDGAWSHGLPLEVLPFALYYAIYGKEAPK